jgi:hypothetical protein
MSPRVAEARGRQVKDYAVRLRCPYRDEDRWVVLENRPETLEQVLQTPWDFECSLHGVQRELPLEASEKRSAGGPQIRGAEPKAGSAPKIKPRAEQRSSKRASLQVPVTVYGWAKNQGAFHEDTYTVLVNSSGGLVTLSARVEVGESLFVVNKNTREEQECRVVYVQQEMEGKLNVGLAFKREIPGFWRTNPRKARLAKTIQVWVRGVDRSGNPFVQSAHTIDIGKSGARLDGLGYLTGPGEIVQVKRGWRKARFRVVWIGQLGSAEANQVGICCVEPDKDIWRVPIAESETGKDKEKKPPRS